MGAGCMLTQDTTDTTHTSTQRHSGSTGGSTGGSRPGDHVEVPVDNSAISVPRALKIETYVVYTLLTPIRC